MVLGSGKQAGDFSERGVVGKHSAVGSLEHRVLEVRLLPGAVGEVLAVRHHGDDLCCPPGIGLGAVDPNRGSPVHAEPVDVGRGLDVSNGLPLSEAAGVAVPPADSVGNPVSDAPAVGPPLVGDGDELRPAEPQEHSTTRRRTEAVTAASRERGRLGCIGLMLTVASSAGVVAKPTMQPRSVRERPAPPRSRPRSPPLERPVDRE